MAELFSELDMNTAPSERGFATRQEMQGALHRMLAHFEPIFTEMIEELAVVTRLFFTNTEDKAGQIIANAWSGIRSTSRSG
ncbi:hypothetical protein ACWGHM_41435 [Streptomyces sp. NPDC054904]